LCELFEPGQCRGGGFLLGFVELAHRNRLIDLFCRIFSARVGQPRGPSLFA